MLTLVLEKLKTKGCGVVVVVVGGGCVCMCVFRDGGRGGQLAKLNQATVEVHKSARPKCSQGGGWWQNQNQNQGPERSSDEWLRAE